MDRRTALQLFGGAVAIGAAPASAWAAAGLSAVDRMAIQDVLNQWMWAMDTGDGASLLRTMTPDGRIVDRRGAASPAATFAKNYAGPTARRGRIHELQINDVRSDGRGVKTKSYWATVSWKAGDPAPLVDGLGTYTDTLVRRDGGWRIAERVIGTWDSSTVNVAKL